MAQATDFVEKIWPLSYGHNARKKYDYPAEGHYPVAFPANGYLWDLCRRHGVSYKNYGEGARRAWFGLPNILSRDFVVPELIQDDATPEALAFLAEKPA